MNNRDINTIKYKSKLTFITLVIVFIYSCNHHLYVNDWKEMQCKGNISSLTEKYYLAVKKNDTLVKGESTRHFGYSGIKVLFNDNGNYVEIERHFSEDSIIERNVYERDEYGNLINEYIYKPEGELFDILTVKNTFNRYGYRIKEIQTVKNDKLRYKKSYKYDNKGNCVEVIWCHSCEDCCEDPIKYIYDENGNCIEEVKYMNTGFLSYKTSYSYEKNGNVTEEKIYMGTNPVADVISYKYVYDEYGNWVQKIITENQKKIIAERTYQYYE